jgi:hypoxanthine phosphoribosyltransferase
MQKVKVQDKEFELYLQENEILASIDSIAQKLNKDLKGKNPLFIAILNGAFMFASELFKRLDLDCEISFVKYSSYAGTSTTGIVSSLIGADESVTGRNVVILEDIVDTGITMEKVVRDVKAHDPESVRIATLLYKPAAFQKDYPIDYVGIEIPNDFIVGFGPDYNGYGRNLKDIYKIAAGSH